MKLFKFKQKVSEVIEANRLPKDAVKISRNKNGDFRADLSDGTVAIGGYNTSDFTVYHSNTITL